MKHARKRLTYANVMSSLAVFLVLGGATAFAASQLGKNSVGSKQLKNNAVTSAKIKKNAITTAKVKKAAITGAKLKLSTIGTVPKAASVGGNTVTAINFAVDPPVGPTQILSLDGFTVTASCPASKELAVTVTGPSGARAHTYASTTNGGIGSGTTDENTVDDITASPPFDLLRKDNDLVNGHTQLDLGSGGRSVSIVWDAESYPIERGPDCTFIGYAIG
jgi:hypothetical protein